VSGKQESIMQLHTSHGTALLILGLLFSLPQPAFAQDGGTYCVGPSYLAYELAQPAIYDSTHGVSPARHSLHVLPLDATGTIGVVQDAPLPVFTVHGMQCLATQVRLLGWDSLYTMPWTAASLGPLTRQGAPWAGRGASRASLPDFPDSTLWHGWSPQAVDTVLLPLTAGQAKWGLTIEARESNAAMCEYRIETRLVRFATAQRPPASKILYNEVRPGECGE